MTIFVDNKNPHPVRLRSFDGHTIAIPANTINNPVGDKFAWHVPHGVKFRQGPPDVIDHTTIVRGKAFTPKPHTLPPKTAEEAKQREQHWARDVAKLRATQTGRDVKVFAPGGVGTFGGSVSAPIEKDPSLPMHGGMAEAAKSSK